MYLMEREHVKQDVRTEITMGVRNEATVLLRERMPVAPERKLQEVSKQIEMTKILLENS